MAYSLFRPPSSSIELPPPTARSLDLEGLGDDQRIEITNVPHSSTTEGGLTWKLLEGWPLCHFCHAIVRDLPARGQSKEEATTMEEIAERISSTSCDLCHVISQVRERLGWKRSSPVCVRAHGPEHLEIEPWTGPSGFLSLTKGFISDESGAMFDIKADKDGLLSPESTYFIQQRLENCLTHPSHSICTRTWDIAADWPQRILGILDEKVVLLDFDRSRTRKFAALSYCWGSMEELERTPPLKLTATTFDDLRSGVPIPRLPLTLQQAVKICKDLSLEYIWIDALCIIQGDPYDWANESKKMATVYSTATVTIIAASSTSCHSGFLASRANAFVINLPNHSDPSVRILAQTEAESGFHPSRTIGDPIDTRGWTLQEELLSTRYIKFTRNDVQWKCNAGTECMCRQPTTVFQKLDGSHSTECSPLEQKYREEWYDVVVKFSSRRFSDNNDKLQALSGLARVSQSRIQSSYLAGIWRSHIEPGPSPGSSALAWYVKDTGISYDTYVAPSFSWASVQAPISFPDGCQDWLCQVHDIGTTPVTPSDPFGRVSEGFLKISGPLLECRVEGFGRKPAHEEKTSVNISWELVRYAMCEIDCPVRRIALPDDNHSLCRHPQGQTEFAETVAHVLVLYWFDRSLWLHGLLLGRDPSRQAYQRLGFVQVMLHKEVKTSDTFWSRNQQEITIY